MWFVFFVFLNQKLEKITFNVKIYIGVICLKCLVCGKDFVIKRGFDDILRTKKEFVCDKCYQENPINIEFNYIPLTNHQLEIVSLFKTSYINHDAFINEYSQIYQKLKQEKGNKPIYLYDSFVLTEDKINEFDYLSKELDEDITILTNTYSN